jgi:CPA1 family monovalent cation:H+ antiporter
MNLFHILALLLAIAALFSYLNHRFLRLPTTIGIMMIALLFSLGLLMLKPLIEGLEDNVVFMLRSVDFDATVLHGMLNFLLFAGALHVNLTDLAEKLQISAPIAIVVAGLLIGNHGKLLPMPERTREHLDTFRVLM